MEKINKNENLQNLELAKRLVGHYSFPAVKSALYKVGDILEEDRSLNIGTSREDATDKLAPLVRFRVDEIDLDRGIYWLYNLTREVYTIGHIAIVDVDTKQIKKIDN